MRGGVEGKHRAAHHGADVVEERQQGHEADDRDRGLNLAIEAG